MKPLKNFLIRAVPFTLAAVTSASILFWANPANSADQSIMFEVGVRFDNNSFGSNGIDFGAIRYRYDDSEIHVATFGGKYAAGIGYVLNHEGDDASVSFTPGISYVTGDLAPRAFYRAGVGWIIDDTWSVEVAQTSYMPFTKGDADAFLTVGVKGTDRDDPNNHYGENKNSSDDNSNTGDDGGSTPNNPGNDTGGAQCKPGNGYGDTNHCHSGPPGLNK